VATRRLRASLNEAGGPASGESATMFGDIMRVRAIHPDDIVLVNKRGRIFHAKVRRIAAAGGFDVAPIERGITYRHVKATEITDHWPHGRRSRDEPPPPGQTSFDDLGP